MTPNQLEATSVKTPNELEILVTRNFDAPVSLVFDVLTKPEHVRRWFAPFEDKMTVCSIDLQVGGKYHFVFVTDDGTECSFRGTYIEIDPPIRTVETWLFEGWPDAEALETIELLEKNGVTQMITRLAFRDEVGRAHMTDTDGFEDSFNKMAHYLKSLSDARATNLES